MHTCWCDQLHPPTTTHPHPATKSGSQPSRCGVRPQARRRRLRQQPEERQEERQGRTSRATRRQDIPAVPFLLLPPRRAVCRQHVQSVSGRARRRSFDLADRRDLVRVAAGANDLAAR